MRTIELTQGKVALVDDEDYEYLCQFKWFACRQYGGRIYYPGTAINRQPRFMHKLLFPNQRMDHIDGDGLNNQRSNLRIASATQNSHNRKKRTDPTSSRFKGVSWVSQRNCWRAVIQVDGRQKHLGYFTVEENAALAYNEAAQHFFGEFAKINILC